MIKFMSRPYEEERDWLDDLLDYSDDREDEQCENDRDNKARYRL